MKLIPVRDWFDDVNAFLDAANAPRGNLTDVRPDLVRIEFCKGHVVEEWEVETKEALARYCTNPSLENLVEVADGIGDTIYVLCQLARSLGIPLSAVWTAIHDSNMGKVSRLTGRIERNPETGKVLKPEGWKPPDIWSVLKRYQDMEHIQNRTGGADSWSNTAEVMAKHSGESK